MEMLRGRTLGDESGAIKYRRSVSQTLEINNNGGLKLGQVESCLSTTKNISPLPQYLWPPNMAGW